MKRKLFLSVVLVLILIPLGPGPQMAPPAATGPATVYVDDDVLVTGSGTIDHPFATIAQGIAAVAAGGTVIVAPGTYAENLTINKSLTLRGSGLDVTTIQGTANDQSTIALSQQGISVTVEHFAITGGGTNDVSAAAGLKGIQGSTIYARWNWFVGNLQHGVISYGPDVIERNLFTAVGDSQGSDYAIWASQYSTPQIYNNTLRQTIGGVTGARVGSGVAIYSWTGGTPSVPDIRNNIIYNFAAGIESQFEPPSASTHIDYNILYNNTSDYAGGVSGGANDQLVDPNLTTTYYLNTGSPALNAGDPAAAFNDRDGSRNDVGMRQAYLTGAAGYNHFATPTSRQPLGLAAYGRTAVWLSSYIYEPGIYRLDDENGDPLQTLAVPGNVQYQYGGLAFDGATDTLYHSTIYGGSSSGVGGIQVLNAETGAILDTLPFTVTSGGDLAWDGTYLWQAAGGWMDPKIYQINATTGAMAHSFASPVPGQTQTFGMTYGDGALWLSKGQIIYKIDPSTESIVCSFRAPVDDVRGLAFVAGRPSYLMASSFGHDQVRRVDLPSWCAVIQPSAKIYAQWQTCGHEHSLQYQPAYSNEAVCVPRAKWATQSFVDGAELPKSVGGTVRGLRFRTGDPAVVVSEGKLSGATLTQCGDDGTWVVWSASPVDWVGATGTLDFDWHPRPKPGISINWRGAYSQTLRYQYTTYSPGAPCAPDRTAWSNVTLGSGDYLPLPIGPKGANYNGLLLDLSSGDSLTAEVLDDKTHLQQCNKEGLRVLYSDTPDDFVRAYGFLWAVWGQLPEGKLPVEFQGTGAGEPHQIEWQAIGEGESACGGKSDPWTKQTLNPGDPLPMDSGRGVRIRLPRQDLLNVKRAEGLRTMDCGGGVTAIYALDPKLWAIAQGRLVIDWAALFENLHCVWFQHTETVAHNRDLGSHLWCQDDGTATVFFEGGGSDTVEVVDGYAHIPAGVNKVRPGGLYAGDLTAVLKDRLPVTMHVVPVNLVDVDIDAPTIEILWLMFDLWNLPFFDIDWDVEPEIDVAGDTAAEIWDNMETAMNGQPAVVGTDAYMLAASSAVGYELWFGQGPFNTWKGMFFLEHQTTFIHELLHSLLGLKHVGGAPGPDPAWPYGNTRTFPEEATFYGIVQPSDWDRLHFTGDDCDALMSYGNSNPYGLSGNYRVRCLSPFTGDKAWDKIGTSFSSLSIASTPASGPVMWLEGPDLFQFRLTHSSAGSTGGGPELVVNPDTSPLTITVASYETHHGFFSDSFVSLPEGLEVESALFDGRQYPPDPFFGTLATTSVASDAQSRTLTVDTNCAWLLSAEDDLGERLVSGPYVGDRTVHVGPIEVNLQLSCADGESVQPLLFPAYVYLPLIRR